MALTKDDARAIADAFLEAAEVVDGYLDRNFDSISRAEYEFLNESFKTLSRVASFATTEAVGLAIADMDDPAAQLKTVIAQTKDKIKTLQTVGLTIRFVAGLVDLGAGIMAKDPKAIFNSAKNLGKLVVS